MSTALLGPPLTAPEPAAAAAGPPLDAAQQQLDRPGLPAGVAPAAAAAVAATGSRCTAVIMISRLDAERRKFADIRRRRGGGYLHASYRATEEHERGRNPDQGLLV